jgi:aryl-alcohol dehydrogenase-like predicted oxidoreductase
MDSSKVPAFARTAVGVFESFCSERQLERRKFAVDYVRHMSSEAFLVIGAELPEQARENCLLMRQPRVESGVFGAWEESWPEDQMPLVNPSQWPQNRRRTYR